MADGYALRFDGVAYPAEAERLFHSTLAMPGAATRARPGIRAGGGLVVTVGGGPESASVSPGSGIITDTVAGLGSWFFVIPTTVSKALATRPASGQSRLDEVVARINTTSNEVEIAVITGTATAGTPTAPTIPTGQLRLAELLVPASGSVSVQKPGQRIAALGGILPVASAAERDAIEVIYDSLVIYREDTDTYQARVNGNWVTLPLTQDWTTFALTSLQSGWTTPTLRYSKVGDRVELDMAFTNPTLTTDSAGNMADITIGTVPTEIRPANDIPIFGQKLGTCGLGFRLNANGNLAISYATAASASIGSGIVVRDSYTLG
jgi:hypothetical protein